MSLLVNKRDSDYTDFLLASCLHTYGNSFEKCYLMTADKRSMPLKIFDIIGTITTVNNSSDISVFYIYELNKDNCNSMKSKI